MRRAHIARFLCALNYIGIGGRRQRQRVHSSPAMFGAVQLRSLLRGWFPV